MDEWQGGLSPLQNLKWITLTFSLFSLSSPPFSLFYAIRWKQPTSLMWPFPVCGMRTKALHFLSMLLPSLSIFLFLFICRFSFQAVLLPFFHLLDLMIYFARTSDLCSTEVLSVTSKERSMSIISIVDSDKDKTGLGISPLSLAVLLIIALISFQAASWICSW